MPRSCAWACSRRSRPSGPRIDYAERLLLEFRGQIPAGAQLLDRDADAKNRSVVLSTAPAPAAADSAPVAAATASPAERPALRLALHLRPLRDRCDESRGLQRGQGNGRARRPALQPALLHAGTGQGKTHLMHAIGYAFLEANPAATAIYVTAERFMFEFAGAAQQGHPRVQGAAALGRPADDRRPAVHRRQGRHAGRSSSTPSTSSCRRASGW